MPRPTRRAWWPAGRRLLTSRVPPEARAPAQRQGRSNPKSQITTPNRPLNRNPTKSEAGAQAEHRWVRGYRLAGRAGGLADEGDGSTCGGEAGVEDGHELHLRQRQHVLDRDNAGPRRARLGEVGFWRRQQWRRWSREADLGGVEAARGEEVDEVGRKPHLRDRHVRHRDHRERGSRRRSTTATGRGFAVWGELGFEMFCLRASSCASLVVVNWLFRFRYRNGSCR
jgi:hypothetical protein